MTHAHRGRRSGTGGELVSRMAVLLEAGIDFAYEDAELLVRGRTQESFHKADSPSSSALRVRFSNEVEVRASWGEFLDPDATECSLALVGEPLSKPE
jgi:hypothetical protein